MGAPFIIVMGPQGSGKGTQAKMLADHLGGVTFSSGDLWRASSDPELAERQSKGLYASSDVIINLVDEFISAVPKEKVIVSDAFPRMLAEAEWLVQILPRLDRELTAVISLVVPRDESVQRLLKRARNETRTDDTPEAIHRRLDLYNSETGKVSAMWRAQGVLQEVDGVGSIEEIAMRINKVIDAA